MPRHHLKSVNHKAKQLELELEPKSLCTRCPFKDFVRGSCIRLPLESFFRLPFFQGMVPKRKDKRFEPKNLRNHSILSTDHGFQRKINVFRKYIGFKLWVIVKKNYNNNVNWKF